jgi:predicted ATPase
LRLLSAEGLLGKWSYERLSEPERMLLARLSVFFGGWTLEAVCCGNGIEEGKVLDLLTHLVDKSMVVAHSRRRGLRGGPF